MTQLKKIPYAPKGLEQPNQYINILKKERKKKKSSRGGSAAEGRKP